MTSGPRYCLVLTILDLCLLSYVAPPKSITTEHNSMIWLCNIMIIYDCEVKLFILVEAGS
jgi:hypothetical protein